MLVSMLNLSVSYEHINLLPVSPQQQGRSVKEPNLLEKLVINASHVAQKKHLVSTFIVSVS